MGAVDFRLQDPPRKASILTDHPFYNSYSKHIGLKFNDKVLTRSVFTYDADEGYIEVGTRDARGRWRAERGQIILVRIPGKVEPYWR